MAGTSCDCADTGFAGHLCQTDINECASVNVCSFDSSVLHGDYTCRNEQPFYSCVGQFPDWPLADPPNRYSAYSGIVEDLKTGLTWQQAGQGPRSWNNANNYCSGLSLAGFSDWRLPTRAELESIIDFANPEQMLDLVFAGNGGEFWSYSLVAGSSDARWVVDFTSGVSHAFGPTTDPLNHDWVRCVRREF
jgi:hypothetical protein